MNSNLNVNAIPANTGNTIIRTPDLTSIKYSKIPEATLNRPAWKQTTAVEIAHAVDCPTCKAPAGYYCITKTGNKRGAYHVKRFESYMRTSKHYPHSTTSRGTKHEELKGH